MCGHLWSDVVRCPTEGRRPKVVLHVLLTHAEVCDLYMTLRVQQHVIQLQISTGGIHKTYRNQSSASQRIVRRQFQFSSWFITRLLPINNSFRVQELETADDLGCVKPAEEKQERGKDS